MTDSPPTRRPRFVPGPGYKVFDAYVEVHQAPALEAETPTAAALWGLYFAIYHAEPDVVLGLPRSVQDAYGTVQRIHMSRLATDVANQLRAQERVRE